MSDLSPTMQEALDKARANGLVLVRRPGGFWTYKGCPQDETSRNGAPLWYTGTQTVKSLIARDLAKATAWAGATPFAVEVTVTKE